MHPTPNSSSRIPSLAGVALLAIACVGSGVGCWLIMDVDAAIGQILRTDSLRGDIAKIVMLSEAFAHFSGVVFILGTLLWIDRERRQILLFAVLLTSLSGLVANGAKAMVQRVRPHSIESVRPSEKGALDSQGWGTKQNASFWDSRYRSFPSGHAATAVALALGLAYCYPKGWPIFSILALLACYQRIYAGAHYLSDVLAGVCIACFLAAIFFGCITFRTHYRKQRRDDIPKR